MRSSAVAGRCPDLLRADHQYRELRLHPKAVLSDLQPSQILVDLWLPEGSSFEEVEREAKRLEQQLSKNLILPMLRRLLAKAPHAFICHSTSS